MATDEELIAAVVAGDETALATLYHRYERPLHAFLARQTGTRDLDDLVQETWLRVVRAAARFDPARRFSTWLFQIALNLARDWRRRPPPEAVGSERSATVAGPGPFVASDAGNDASDAAIDVHRLLAALPETHRAVVVLRHFHDLGEDEVAAILDIPRGTVKSRLHHAMARLVAMVRDRERTARGEPEPSR